MNLRDLDYIVAVADHSHFGRAAQAVAISQPALSGQIAKVEQELGITIFERGNRSVSLTSAGAAILPHARAALAAAEAIRATARASKDPFADPLRLGLIPTLAPFLLPKLLPRLDPRIRLAVREATTAELLTELRTQRLDAVLIATDPGEPALEEEALFYEPFWLALPEGHALDRPGPAALASVEEQDLLLLADGHCLTDQVLASCGRSAGPLDVSAASLETLIQLVAAKLGYTLLPALACQRELPKGVKLRQIDEGAGRTVRMVWRKGFSRREVLAALAQNVRDSGA